MSRGNWKNRFYTRSDGAGMLEWCRKNDVIYNTAYKYVTEDGLSVDDACEKAKANRNKAGVKARLFYKGKSLLKYCKEHNIIYMTVWYRHKIRGMSLDEAIELGAKDANAKI